MEAKHLLDVWSHIILFDLLRYLIPASLFFLLFWVIARKKLAHLFIQRSFPKSLQLWKEFAYSMSTVIIFSLVGLSVYVANQAGLTCMYQHISEYGIAYMVISLIITLVFHDFYFYWTHRLMHHKRLFRYIHHIHHESINPSPWAAYSFHPWEALIQAMVFPILVFTVPLHPLTIFLFLTYMILRNVIGHLGFEILPAGFTKNKWLNWNTAITHHNMHHEHFRCNYGLYFTWWDKLMKTEHKKYHEAFDEVKSRPKTCTVTNTRSTTKKTRSISTILLILLASNALVAQTVIGKWMTFNEKTGSPLSIIEITASGNSIEGHVIRIFLEPHQGEDPLCVNCPDTFKNKRVIGMNFLWGFKEDGPLFTNGKILDPESGTIYNGKCWLANDSTLHVRGYAGPFDLFYRTQTWKREGISYNKTPVGIWRTIDDHWGKVKSVVEIKSVNGELKGYIRKIFLMPNEGTDPICTECHDKLKNQKIVGMKILWNFSKNEDKWMDGKILDPANGNIYTSSLWLTDDNTLNVRGYLGPFYRSQSWRRIK